MDRGQLILVTGGARSGKSTFAEQLAAQLGTRITYIATAEVRDEEMAGRIARHRRRRPSDWRTVEAPFLTGPMLAQVSQTADVVLVDCLTLLVTNRLLAAGENAVMNGEITDRIVEEMAALAESARRVPAHVVIVSNEVGFGVVPPTPLGRVFRDLAGLANQRMAALADAVYLTISGIPVELKSLAVKPGKY